MPLSCKRIHAFSLENIVVHLRRQIVVDLKVKLVLNLN